MYLTTRRKLSPLVPEVPQGKAIVNATKKNSIYFAIWITFFLRRLSEDEDDSSICNFLRFGSMGFFIASCHFCERSNTINAET
jgi:hypothetical protein